MTHGHSPEHAAPTTHSGPTVFPPNEMAGFQSIDRDAARNIVLLMTTIFSLGIIGYTIVCLWMVV